MDGVISYQAKEASKAYEILPKKDVLSLAYAKSENIVEEAKTLANSIGDLDGPKAFLTLDIIEKQVH
ncbi:MAG: hypothetical protein IID32_06395, partial [Planctomycetes bacterium]|nr:hypothetical protein [Planctomycetota bacterium]